jgi:RNA polymerase sigma-70 factor, ECF subfamily
VEIAETELRRQLAALLPELRAFARFLARDRVAADDLVQDAVVRGLGALHQFQRGTSLKAWMFTILRNGFYEQRRRHKRESAAMAEIGADEGLVDVHADRSAVADLQRLIWTLPPLLREALILVGAQELSHEEAATVCGVPVGTMKARLSRARTELARRSRDAVE